MPKIQIDEKKWKQVGGTQLCSKGWHECLVSNIKPNKAGTSLNWFFTPLDVDDCQSVFYSHGLSKNSYYFMKKICDVVEVKPKDGFLNTDPALALTIKVLVDHEETKTGRTIAVGKEFQKAESGVVFNEQAEKEPKDDIPF